MNKTVVNASGDTHYKENKENFRASVQFFIYTQKNQYSQTFYEQNTQCTNFFLKNTQFCALSYMCLYYYHTLYDCSSTRLGHLDHISTISPY